MIPEPDLSALSGSVVIPEPDLSAVAGVIGVGIDVVDVARFGEVLARRPRVRDRCFTAGEQAAAASRPDPVESLAARFAAKEAVLKVLGLGIFDVPLTEIEVCGGGTVAVWLAPGPSLERAASAHGIGGWRLSLTHSGGVAAAVAVGLA